MKLSFFCQNCGGHLRHGDHSACKRILRKQKTRPREKTLRDSSVEYLAKTGKK